MNLGTVRHLITLSQMAFARGQKEGQMTTNGEWLFSKPFEEQVAWTNAEHQDGTLDGDTAALNARINELRAHERELRELSRQLVYERELYREALSQLLDAVTDGMSKVSAILDNYDEGMA